MKRENTILIGIGECEDPLPELEKNTRYLVLAGPCEKCQGGGRLLLVRNNELFLLCEDCKNLFSVSIPSEKFHEVSYVYWCNRSKFQTDYVKLSAGDLEKIEAAVAALDESDIPRWAVLIIGGICMRSNECVNFSCLYNSRGGVKNVQSEFEDQPKGSDGH
ncbi:MAG: hypothetical protein ACOYXC_06675 [Candidatus Rifleibacteriota bacterium]